MSQLNNKMVLLHQDLAALAVDHAGLGVWEIVTASGAWHCSSRCKQLLGIRHPMDPIDALGAEDRWRFTEAIDRAIRHGEFHLEFRVHQRWFAAVGRVVRKASGPMSIVGTLQDITGHRVAVEVCLGEVGIELAKLLAAIRVGVGLLHDATASPELITSIEDTVGAMQRLVNELIEFGRSVPRR